MSHPGEMESKAPKRASLPCPKGLSGRRGPRAVTVASGFVETRISFVFLSAVAGSRHRFWEL